METINERSVVVVGGGIAGLAAAWELSGGARPDPAAPRVTVLESSSRLGGALHSVPFDDTVVDVGPDGFLGRRPEATELCREVGLGDQLVAIGASGAWVYARKRLRPLPAGLMLGVPTRWWPVARSGVLGAMGSARLLRDALLPRPDRRGPLGDRALGPLVARRQGRRVVEALVDPLIGGIHAGSVADMSTAAAMPQLLTVPPAFWALQGGMGTLIERLAQGLAARGVQIRTQVTAGGLARDLGERAWTVQTSDGPVDADGVVLALPSGPAGELLAPHDANAAALERTIDYGSVAVITLSYPDGAVSLPRGTGFLVPRNTRSPIEGGGDGDVLVTACTFLDVKWPHLQRPGRLLLRASVGRFGDRRCEQMGDRELVARVAEELAALVGITGAPTASMVTRWPEAFPQYRVGHLLRVSGIEASVKRLPALAVAGAPYRGVGIPACIASGREAARSVLESLEEPPAS
ncbi:MAG: protoporphyrinogen oxidase [Acidimicrobiales bacterium]